MLTLNNLVPEVSILAAALVGSAHYNFPATWIAIPDTVFS